MASMVEFCCVSVRPPVLRLVFLLRNAPVVYSCNRSSKVGAYFFLVSEGFLSAAICQFCTEQEECNEILYISHLLLVWFNLILYLFSSIDRGTLSLMLVILKCLVRTLSLSFIPSVSRIVTFSALKLSLFITILYHRFFLILFSDCFALSSG